MQHLNGDPHSSDSTTGDPDHVEPDCLDCGDTPVKLRRGRCNKCYKRLRRREQIAAGQVIDRTKPAEPPESKLLRQIVPNAEGCWIFTGAPTSDNYGAFYLNGKCTTAHRASYLLFVGEVPAGWTIDHTCHNESGCLGGRTCLHRRCANPDHLEAVPSGVNIRRSPNTLASKFGRRDRCASGHEYTTENTWLYVNKGQSRPVRKCKACARKKKRADKVLTGEESPPDKEKP